MIRVRTAALASSVSGSVLSVLSVIAASVGACGGHVTALEPETEAGPIDAGPADALPPSPQTLAITEVSLFQGPKVPLSNAGAKVTTRYADPVVGRAGMLRVYTKPGTGWKRKTVLADLRVARGAATPLVLAARRDVGLLPSSDGDLASTFDFDVPADKMGVDTTYAVVVHGPSGGVAGAPDVEYARYPEGDAPPERMGAIDTGRQLKIKIVPVRYDADGSGRMPELGPDALAAYRAYMMAMYPAQAVELSVREPIVWKEPTTADGTGWPELLQALTELRVTDAAAKDEYYYGAFAPAGDLWAYCRKGPCVLGLSHLGNDPLDALARASMGLAFGDDHATETMAHEIGHAHGRPHAPCGVSDPEKKFPYDDGTIGAWALDPSTRSLLDPATYDVMSYCDPKWISDYAYGKLAQRMSWLARAADMYFPSITPTRYRFVTVRGDGSLSWGRSITLREVPLAEPHTVTYVTSDGHTKSVTGQYYPFGDLPGGSLLVPEPPTTVVRTDVGGLPGGIDRVLERPPPRP